MSKTVRVYTVLVDIDGLGPAADGTKVFRFRNQADAESFAVSRTCYGRVATVHAGDVPRRIAERWGMC